LCRKQATESLRIRGRGPGGEGEERSEMREPLPQSQSVNPGSSENQDYFK